MPTCCPVLELRQYTLHPGQRDVLIELFDRELVESQEAVGMRVVGQFRDLDNPDRFVWLRGFADMESRRESLVAFYGGPVWKANSAAANATMIDSANVLLLRPIRPQSGFALEKATRPVPGASERSSLIVATLYYLDGPPGDAAIRAFERNLRQPIASLQTEPAENTFPQLPVRTGERVLVSFSSTGAEPPPPELLARLLRAPEQLRLEPTARSLLR
jgi:hypothetical protein